MKIKLMFKCFYSPTYFINDLFFKDLLNKISKIEKEFTLKSLFFKSQIFSLFMDLAVYYTDNFLIIFSTVQKFFNCVFAQILYHIVLKTQKFVLVKNEPSC